MTTRGQTKNIAAAGQPTIPLTATKAGRSTAVEGAKHLILIVPSDEGERQASAMENWFQACASDEPFSLELVGTRREQGFVLRASSEEQLVLLTKQFAAQYPHAELQPIASVADPLLLRAGEHAVIGEFAMTQKPFLPLKTFQGKALAEPGGDPLAGILAAMEPVASGQRIIAQLALVRAPERWIERDIRKSVEHPLQQERDAAARGTHAPSDTREGLKTILLVGGGLGTLVGYHWYSIHAWFMLTLLLLGILVGGIGLLWWWLTHRHQQMYDMKLVAEKLSRAAFYTSLRVIVVGPQATSTRQQLATHLKRLEAAYRQFTLASANSLALKRTRYLTAVHAQASSLSSAAAAFPYAHPLLRLLHRGAPTRDIWNGLELAGAFHLPQSFTDIPLVRRLSVKHLLASPEIARQIERSPAPLPPACIGYSQHRGYTVPVYVPYQTLFSHKFLVARSRYGKSTLIQLLAQAAMQLVTDGSLQPGIAVVDPHQDLIDDLLFLIPTQRMHDVVLLDVTDTHYPVALNPLDASMGFTRDQAIANLMSCFERIWSDFWGPRMAYFLKGVCLLLYTLNEKKVQSGHADEQYTVLDINPLLQYPDYASQALAELEMTDVWHQELFAWWHHVYFALPRQSSFRSEVIMPIISKLGLFQDNQHVRRIVGQPVTRAPMHLAVTQGKIILCSLSSRDMDDAAVNVLGSTLINLLHRSFQLQHHLPLNERRKVFCAIDEFQAFSGGDFDRLLSEDAKLGCSLLLATQSLKRLNTVREGLLEMVLSNCENLWAFNVSAVDAALLEEELRGKVEQKHILSQPRLHCYARLSLPGYPLQIVSLSLAAPASWQRSPERLAQVEALRKHHQRHNATAAEVDRQYHAHLSQFLNVAPYARKLQREVQAARQNRQQREEAEQRAREAYQKQSPPPRVAPSPPSTDEPCGPVTKERPAKDQDQPSASQIQRDEIEGPADLHRRLAGGHPQRGSGNELSGQQTHKGPVTTRNHQRSKRKKIGKDPVGVPPPLPPEVQDVVAQTGDDARLRMSIRGLGGGSFWGYERERRE